jgi:hypothetical protein
METLEKRGPGRPKTEQIDQVADQVADKTVDKKAEPKKKGTKPGWRPSSVLPQLKARDGFTARWCANDSGNIAKKLSEGWILMKPSDNRGVAIKSYDTPDSNSLASEIRFRDSIAMMIADEDKLSRQEYMREESKAATRQILQKTDEEFKRAGVQTYSAKGQSGRIVIE